VELEHDHQDNAEGNDDGHQHHHQHGAQGGDPFFRNMGPKDWTESERRRHRILDALFNAAERQGIQVKQPDRFTVCFEASGERIDYKLSEKHKQVRTPKTPEEMKGLPPGARPWRQELRPTGLLSFSIETYLPALPQRAWTDTADQPCSAAIRMRSAAIRMRKLVAT
jgi:hypothetical protein